MEKMNVPFRAFAFVLNPFRAEPLSFGVAAHAVASLTAGAKRLANLSTPDQSQREEDFVLRIL